MDSELGGGAVRHGTEAQGLIPLLGPAPDLLPALHHFLSLMTEAVGNLRTALAEVVNLTLKRLWG